MPELPEVTTTVNGLNKVLKNLTIKDVWSDYFLRTKNKRKDTIKNKKYFEKFRKEISGEKFKNAERRGKNILIHLTDGKTILVHMKMTGHLLYGKYSWNGKKWQSYEPLLKDSFNQFIHLIFTLSNGEHLAFSDMRKFAKVVLFETKYREKLIDLAGLGPEPLQNLSLETFTKQLHKKPDGKIKTILMDQSIIAGIGNIYSDEILWRSGIHPERKVSKIEESKFILMLKAIKETLSRGINLGGDSMSDYRNIKGLLGKFQLHHQAYMRTGEECKKRG